MIRLSPHIVNLSPWPLLLSLATFSTFMDLVALFKHHTPTMLGPFAMLMIMLHWWRDVSRESFFMGFHTSLVMKGLKAGMILFIASEIMFFFGFFWAFFHSSLSPTMELGCFWPPSGITPIDPFSLPLLNTILLLSSGVTVTASHHWILNNKNKNATKFLIFTIILGVVFTMIQAFEYSESSFTISDSVYGSSFFLMTGFHGLHVMIGAIFLTVSLGRMLSNQFSKTHHVGMELAAWYWHFVDVVWIFLFMWIYWWGS